MHDYEIEHTILAYLLKHPRAGDTLEGIARWWIMHQRLSESVETIQQAIEQLKDKGLIAARKCPDGRTRYVLWTSHTSR